MPEPQFIREDRYLVIKRTTIANHLTLAQRELLYSLASKVIENSPPEKTHDYVVIQDNWPEYEPVWDMLQIRMAKEQRNENR